MPEIITDRPDVTEAAVVVPARSLQFQNGFTWITGHKAQSVDFSHTLIRLGLSSKPKSTGGSRLRSRVGRLPVASGSEDLAIGIKQQLGPLPDGVDLAVIIAVSLPSGRQGIASGGYDSFVKVPWSKELTHGWSVGDAEYLLEY